MAMTMSQKILAKQAGLAEVREGQLIDAALSLVLGNDITAPVAIDEFEKSGLKQVFDPAKVTLVLDHFVPNKDIKAAEQSKRVRQFAALHSIENFFDESTMGIEHVLLPEQGLVGPGDLIIGADSHTCTYGALGAFSTGVGSTDMAAGMASGRGWFKVPGAIEVTLTGQLAPHVGGKDVILHLIGLIGVDGALYKSLEFTGVGVASLSMDDRLCIANMAVEAGAKNGIFPVDEVTISYLEGRYKGEIEAFTADPDARYSRQITIDLNALVPTVACPHLPSNTRPASELSHIQIDQVVIGSCTNGRLSDLQAAAAIVKGKHIAKGVRCIVIPGSRQVYMDALREGLIETFMGFGTVVSTPTCGPCLGGYMGILAAGERAVATTNRNFVGRMGHKDSAVYLSNPAVAAESAVKGYIAVPV